MLVVQVMFLILYVSSTQTENFTTPTLNIIEELGKIKKLEEIIQKQSDIISELKAELELLKAENKANKVAFSASLLASGDGYSGPFTTVQSPLIYKNVHTNIGNGYNAETGIFTAPVKGVYYFRFYAHCHGGITMAVSLYKNGNIQCSVYTLKPVANGNASNGIILALEAGDEIFTKLWDNTWVYDDQNSYTSFGGFLLFPL